MQHDVFRPSRLPASLAGDAVLLRPMRPEELRGVVTAMAGDAVVSRVWSSDPGKLRHWLQAPDSVVFVVEDPAAPGETLGIVQATSHREDPDYEAASLDIGLLEGSRGRGLGPDVLRTLARWLFDECGCHRITIDPAAGNTAAVRAYEKAGFVRIGVARLYERDDRGEWHDNVLLDLLPGDLGPAGTRDRTAEPDPGSVEE
jgi:aminoglycoside 6'-N-acetyltransferase